MASTSETGHFVNLENYHTIIERITEFGTDYDPLTDKIKIPQMTIQWTDGNTLHQDYIVAIEATKLPVNNREDLFDIMTERVKRSFNLYGSTNASVRNLKDAKGCADKITGKNIKVKRLENGTPDPKSVSNSQLSFTKRADNFKHLIEIYKSDPNYATTDTELMTVNLLALLADINAANVIIKSLIQKSNLKRIARDESLYLVGTGIIDVSLACKKYVKSLYGVNSLQAKTIMSIPLRRFMRIKK
jgi:hypothetical protein